MSLFLPFINSFRRTVPTSLRHFNLLKLDINRFHQSLNTIAVAGFVGAGIRKVSLALEKWIASDTVDGCTFLYSSCTQKGLYLTHNNMAKGAKSKAKAKVTKKEEKVEEKVEEEKPTPKKAKGKRPTKDSADAESEEPKPKLAKKNSSISDSLENVDFSLSTKSPSGVEANFKISSWNINGIRAWLSKDGPSYLAKEQPDILCVQELKCDKSKVPSECEIPGYTTHWLSGDTEGYSGVGMYFKNKPISITDGIGIKKHDNEGRVITAEFEQFYLVNTYIPNSGRGLVRHKYRTKEWDNDFLEYLKTLDKKKPVIWCGDLNVAHQEIDIKNAKGNKKNAGFTQEERDNFTAVLESGFIDSFRHLHPEEEHAYSFWAYFMNARAKNVGWRLDYFVISERFKENLCDSVLRTTVMGSDHCPIVLELAL